MQRFLITLLFICTNVIITFGQTDTIPKWKQLQKTEEERIHNTYYNEDYASISLGAKIGHIHLQDRLISPLLYSGYLTGVELELESVRSYRFSLFGSVHYGRSKAPALSRVSTFGDIAGSALEQLEFQLGLSTERKFATSPHFLGGFLSLGYKQRNRTKQSSKNYTGYTRVDYGQVTMGLSYLYRTQISNMPVQAHFTLPLLNGNSRVGWIIGFNPSRLFSPTLRAEVLLPTKKGAFTKLFYTWQFRSIKHAPNSTYNYRYNINSIGIAIMERNYSW